MNKSLNQLENKRREKIKALDLDEVKAYITNLNKKVYESFEDNNLDGIDFYENKLKEVFELTSGQFINLDVYSLSVRYQIVASESIIKDTKLKMRATNSLIILFTNAHMFLMGFYHVLKYILMIYYHNYYTGENMLIDELLAHLSYEYNFNNEKFNEYAHSRVTKYNETLMKELDSLIESIKLSAKLVIDVCDKHLNEDFRDEISFVFKQIEYDKEYLNKKGNDESVSFLKEGAYLDLLDSLKETYITYGESCSMYMEIRDKILNLIESPDGFLFLKEHSYDFDNEHLGVIISKEEYISSRPSYDVKSLKFINQ